MNLTKLIAWAQAMNPDKASPLMYSMSNLARFFGKSQQVMRRHVAENRIPWYRIGGGDKMYNILEVWESIEKTRWAQEGVGRGMAGPSARQAGRREA